MRHAKSRLVESRSASLLSACRSPDAIGEDPDISGDADESAPVRLETAPTGLG